MTSQWKAETEESEIRDVFRIFDKKDRGWVRPGEIKSMLQAHLVVTVTDSEIQGLVE